MRPLSRLVMAPPLLWRLEVRFQHRLAGARLGYVKCLIYRRVLCSYAGRGRYPLFVARKVLADAVTTVETPNRCIVPPRQPRKRSERLAALFAFMEYPRDSWAFLLNLRLDERRWSVQRRLRFDAHVLRGLCHAPMEDHRLAQDDLAMARAIDPDRSQAGSSFRLSAGVALDLRPARHPGVQPGPGGLERDYPDLVDAALEACGLGRITGVLRGLLEEGLSVRDLRGILESMLALEGVSPVDEGHYIVFHAEVTHLAPASNREREAPTVDDYLNCVRMGMKQAISHHYTRGRASLAVYLLEPAIEQALNDRADLEADADRLQDLITAVREATAGGTRPVILTAAHVRRRLWRLLHAALPNLSVLAYQKLAPSLNIQPLARIEAGAFRTR